MFNSKLSYKDIFNNRADSYHKAMLDWPSARDQEFEAILQGLHIAPQDIVVDLPAGGGYLSWYLPDCQLHHIETSELFAELCHSKSPYPLDIADLNNLPFQDNSVDYVLSLAGLHHTENKAELFNEVYRVLKPGGQFVLADASEGSATANFLDGWMGKHNSMGHNGWYFDKTTEQSLLDNSFQITGIADKNYHWCFDTKQQAAQYCKLMFGIDLASESDIEKALGSLLGFSSLKDRVGLNWQLRFINCTKQQKISF